MTTNADTYLHIRVNTQRKESYRSACKPYNLSEWVLLTLDREAQAKQGKKKRRRA